MQVAEVKTSSSAHSPVQAKRQPFFSKEGEGSFFSKSNETTESFFGPNTVQAKLTIGQPNDKYEVEADTMADKVIQRLNTGHIEHGRNSPSNTNTNHNTIQRKCTECEQEEKLQKKDDELLQQDTQLQRKPIFESNAEQPEADVQTKPLSNPVIQKKCANCEKEEELQRKEDEEDQENEIGIQTKSMDTPREASAGLQSRLNSSKGSGSNLSSDVQTSMGSAFGADFSGVRVHTGSEAVQMSQEIGAQAFTHGNDIYFNQGKYDTNSNTGKHLLAHELTHTVQQGKSKYGIQRQEQDDWGRETYRQCLNHRTEVLPQRIGLIADIDRTLIINGYFSAVELNHLKSLIPPNSEERAFVCEQGIRGLIALHDTLSENTIDIAQARLLLENHPERFTTEEFERRDLRQLDRFERLQPTNEPRSILDQINPPVLENIRAYCVQNCPATAAALHNYLRTGNITEAHCSPLMEREQGFGYEVPAATRSFTRWSGGRRSAWRYIQRRTRTHGNFVVVEGDRVTPEADVTRYHYFIILNIHGNRFVVDAYLREVTADIRGYLQRLETRRYSVWVGRFTARPTVIIQPKLKIGQANDKYEIEADAMANKVVQRLIEPTDLNLPERTIGNAIQKKQEPFQTINLIQPKPILESNAESTELDMQKKSIDATSEASSELENGIKSSKGKGSSLSPELENSMSSAIGADFSGVRVHTDSDSIEMNKELGAQAFTHGSDIYFNQGNYNTNSNEGKHLLAHELTHTLQQGASSSNANTLKAKFETIQRISDEEWKGKKERLIASVKKEVDEYFTSYKVLLSTIIAAKKLGRLRHFVHSLRIMTNSKYGSYFTGMLHEIRDSSKGIFDSVEKILNKENIYLFGFEWQAVKKIQNTKHFFKKIKFGNDDFLMGLVENSRHDNERKLLIVFNYTGKEDVVNRGKSFQIIFNRGKFKNEPLNPIFKTRSTFPSYADKKKLGTAAKIPYDQHSIDVNPFKNSTYRITVINDVAFDQKYVPEKKKHSFSWTSFDVDSKLSSGHTPRISFGEINIAPIGVIPQSLVEAQQKLKLPDIGIDPKVSAEQALFIAWEKYKDLVSLYKNFDFWQRDLVGWSNLGLTLFFDLDQTKKSKEDNSLLAKKATGFIRTVDELKLTLMSLGLLSMKGVHPKDIEDRATAEVNKVIDLYEKAIFESYIDIAKSNQILLAANKLNLVLFYKLTDLYTSAGQGLSSQIKDAKETVSNIQDFRLKAGVGVKFNSIENFYAINEQDPVHVPKDLPYGVSPIGPLESSTITNLQGRTKDIRKKFLSSAFDPKAFQDVMLLSAKLRNYTTIFALMASYEMFRVYKKSYEGWFATSWDVVAPGAARKRADSYISDLGAILAEHNTKIASGFENVKDYESFEMGIINKFIAIANSEKYKEDLKLIIERLGTIATIKNVVKSLAVIIVAAVAAALASPAAGIALAKVGLTGTALSAGVFAAEVLVFTMVSRTGFQLVFGKNENSFLADLGTNAVLFGALKAVGRIHRGIFTSVKGDPKVYSKLFKTTEATSVLISLQGLAEVQHLLTEGKLMDGKQRAFAAAQNLALYAGIHLGMFLAKPLHTRLNAELGMVLRTKFAEKFENLKANREALKKQLELIQKQGDAADPVKKKALLERIEKQYNSDILLFKEAGKSGFDPKIIEAEIAKYQQKLIELELTLSQLGFEVKTNSEGNFRIIESGVIAFNDGKPMLLEQIKNYYQKKGTFKDLGNGIYEATFGIERILFIKESQAQLRKPSKSAVDQAIARTYDHNKAVEYLKERLSPEAREGLELFKRHNETSKSLLDRLKELEAKSTEGLEPELLNRKKALVNLEKGLPDKLKEGSPERPRIFDNALQKLLSLDVANDIIQGIVRTSVMEGINTKDFYADLNTMLGSKQLSKLTGYEKILTGLASNSTANRQGALFLMQRASWGQAEAVGRVLNNLTLKEVNSLQLKYKDVIDKELVNRIDTVTNRIDAKAKDIIDLVNKAGYPEPGAKAKPDWIRLLEILGRIPVKDGKKMSINEMNKVIEKTNKIRSEMSLEKLGVDLTDIEFSTKKSIESTLKSEINNKILKGDATNDMAKLVIDTAKGEVDPIKFAELTGSLRQQVRDLVEKKLKEQNKKINKGDVDKLTNKVFGPVRGLFYEIAADLALKGKHPAGDVKKQVPIKDMVTGKETDVDNIVIVRQGDRVLEVEFLEYKTGDSTESTPQENLRLIIENKSLAEVKQRLRLEYKSTDKQRVAKAKEINDAIQKAEKITHRLLNPDKPVDKK
jgi:uncharacterized protein DUF4157